LFNRKLGYLFFVVLLSFALVLSGCSTKKEPKEALQASMAKSSEMKSYSFQGSMKFKDFNIKLAEMTDEDTSLMNMVKSAELSWTGAYQSDPMLTEIVLKLDLKGDMAISFTVPIIMSKEKMWIKVPNIPMLPIPEGIVGKFVELDLKKLAEQAGESLPELDIAKSQQFVNDVLGIVFKNIEGKDYLSSVKKEDAQLPSDAEVDQVIQFHLDKAQVEPFAKTVIEKIGPEVLDLISSNEEYRKMVNLSEDDIKKARETLKDAQSGKLSDSLKKMNEQLKSLDVKANIGIDKEEYPVYTNATIAAGWDVDGDSGSFTIETTSRLKDINKEVKFEVGQPKAEDILTLEQLQEKLGGLFGGAGVGLN
jgi:hypothetical protein